MFFNPASGIIAQLVWAVEGEQGGLWFEPFMR